MVATLIALFLTRQPGPPPFEADIEKFEAADKLNPPEPGGIVFIGSSSIVRWTTLKQDFPGYNVINRGFGGSSISDSVRFADRIVTPYKPKFIVFFAGTNDINDGKPAETVFHDYQAFVDKVRAKLSGERILYISITPAPSRQAKWPVMKEANRLIQDYCKDDGDLLYLDEWSHFLTSQQGPRPELFVQDQLHMNPSGYAIWLKDLKPIVDREMKKSSSRPKRRDLTAHPRPPQPSPETRQRPTRERQAPPEPLPSPFYSPAR